MKHRETVSYIGRPGDHAGVLLGGVAWSYWPNEPENSPATYWPISSPTPKTMTGWSASSAGRPKRNASKSGGKQREKSGRKNTSAFMCFHAHATRNCHTSPISKSSRNAIRSNCRIFIGKSWTNDRRSRVGQSRKRLDTAHCPARKSCASSATARPGGSSPCANRHFTSAARDFPRPREAVALSTRRLCRRLQRRLPPSCARYFRTVRRSRPVRRATSS